jgi:hypothetical protein
MAKRKRKKYKVTLLSNGKPMATTIKVNGQYQRASSIAVEQLCVGAAAYPLLRIELSRVLPLNWNLPMKEGQQHIETATISLKVECLGEVGRKKYTPKERAKRAQVKAQKEQEREMKKQAEARRNEQAMLAQRARIVNEIELAFVKQGKEAAKFCTCDICSSPAAYLLLSHQPEGTSIPFDTITGARCSNCWNPQWVQNTYMLNHGYYRLWGTKAACPCAEVEFFYDGLRQLYINKAA